MPNHPVKLWHYLCLPSSYARWQWRLVPSLPYRGPLSKEDGDGEDGDEEDEDEDDEGDGVGEDIDFVLSNLGPENPGTLSTRPPSVISRVTVPSTEWRGLFSMGSVIPRMIIGGRVPAPTGRYLRDALMSHASLCLALDAKPYWPSNCSGQGE